MNGIMLGLFVVMGIGLLTMPAFADVSSSPLKQMKMGVPINEIQCTTNKILMQSPSGKPACLSENTSAKLADRGYTIVQVIKVLPTNNTIDTVNYPLDDDSELLENTKDVIQTTTLSKTNQTASIQQREDYLSSLSLGLVGDGKFEGELYGYNQNVHLRQPAPAPYKWYFPPEHYTFTEADLVGKDSLDIIEIPSQVSDTSTPRAGPPIDYREWLPSYVAPGYYLKWVDIIQPEDQWTEPSEGQGQIKFSYIPKDFDISEDIMNDVYFDLNFYEVEVAMTDKPTSYMKTEEEIAKITRDGTATDIVFEDRWDGQIMYVYGARSDPAKHGLSYESPYIYISSGGSALSMEEHENIVIELFERYSSR